MSDNSDNTDGTNADQPSILEQLVGEGKRYSSVEELAKAKVNADQFIEQLKSESGQLRTDLDNRMTLEDLLKQKDSSTNDPVVETDTPAADDPAPETPEAEPKDDKDDLGAKIRAIMSEENDKRTTEANMKDVASRVRETYGDDSKAQEQILAKAAELGLNVEFLLDTAAASPKAFYEIMGIKASAPKSAGGPTKGDVNTSNFSASQSPVTMNHSDYNEMRRKDPRRYYTPKIQNEIMKAAAERGADFLNN